MSNTVAERPSLRAPNGHFLEKGGGNCLYSGPLENLPRPQSVDIESAVAQMYSDGYVIFPNVLSRDEVAQLRSFMDKQGGPDDEKWVVKGWCYNRHQLPDFQHDPRLLTYLDRPGIIDVVRGIHDPGAQITGSSFWTTGAGRAMGIHVDYQPVSLPESVHDDPAIAIPIFSSTVHYYLNDMTADLGPTTLVPGSHKAGRPPFDESTWRGVTPKAAMVQAGDAVLFRGDLWHGAWMNSSQTDRRYMMQVHYGNQIVAKGYPPMRHDQYWSPDVIAQATASQKQLLGYRGEA